LIHKLVFNNKNRATNILEINIKEIDSFTRSTISSSGSIGRIKDFDYEGILSEDLDRKESFFRNSGKRL